MPLLSHHATVSARTPLAFNSAARAARSVLTGAPSDGWTEVRSGEGTRAAQYAHAADTAGRIAIWGSREAARTRRRAGRDRLGQYQARARRRRRARDRPLHRRLARGGVREGAGRDRRARPRERDRGRA